MKETEKLGNAQSQKEKIRERYKGIDTDQLDVIPALPQDSFYEDKREKRVAVYARVSTDDSIAVPKMQYNTEAIPLKQEPNNQPKLENLMQIILPKKSHKSQRKPNHPIKYPMTFVYP